MNQSANGARDAWIFPRFWAVILVGLIGVTYRLWIPEDDSPAVPLLGILVGAPDWIDVSLSTVLVIAAVVVTFSRKTRPWIWWIAAAMLCGLFALDQHRLQPWAYQSLIYAMLFATLKPSIARQWIVPLAASVYIYSSLGKLDYQFVHTVGIDFLETVFKPIGGLADKLGFSTRALLAHLFPVAELIAGVLLLPKATRRWAGAAVMILHGCLVGMLGPWGLNHSAGVLLWNVGLMGQAWLLFVRSPAADAREQDGIPARLFQWPPGIDGKRPWVARLVCMTVLFAIVMPVFERAGYWDHWLSWALYSPHNSRVDVQIHRSGIQSLPPRLREFMEDDADGDRWQALSLEDWSLGIRNAPVYPQARYQLALAIAMAKQAGLDDQIRARLRGVSSRRTGKRTEQPLLNRREMQQALSDFWFVPHAGGSKD